MLSSRYVLTILLFICLVADVAAFTVIQKKVSPCSSAVILSMSEPDDQPEKLVTAADLYPKAESIKPTKIDIETTYPIPLPSPLLLGGSMILGIASTGSIFELSGGNPQYGYPLTGAIVALGLPSCLFLFYAAIKKGMAETEEDDKRFLQGK